MEIADSARRHGITDDAIWHALRNSLRALPAGPDKTLYIGADQSTRLLELVVLDDGDSEPAVTHAMPCRPKFYNQL